MKALERAKYIERDRKQHHQALEALALRVACTTDGLTLWRKLNRLERRLHAACEHFSNEGSYGQDRWEKDKQAGCEELRRIFGGQIPEGVYINGDPRGHSLKLDCDEAPIPEGMQRDWGGNGILAAEIE